MSKDKLATRRVREHLESVHLNITPFIDIMVCLILFLLSSVAIMKLSVLDTTLPRLTQGSDAKQQMVEKDQVTVVIKILKSGFRISRVGQDSSATRQAMWGEKGHLSGRIGRSAKGP